MRGPVSIFLTLLLLAVPFVLSGGGGPHESKPCCCDTEPSDAGAETVVVGSTVPVPRDDAAHVFTWPGTRTVVLVALTVVLRLVTAVVLHLLLDA